MSKQPTRPENCPTPEYHKTHHYCPSCSYSSEQIDAIEITNDFIDSIEDEVGYASGGWDFVDPKELVAAVLKHSPQLAAMTKRAEEAEKERDELKIEQGKAWGIEFCCSGHECGCMGQPVNPPPWWIEQTEEIDRLKKERDELREVVEAVKECLVDESDGEDCDYHRDAIDAIRLIVKGANQ